MGEQDKNVGFKTWREAEVAVKRTASVAWKRRADGPILHEETKMIHKK